MALPARVIERDRTLRKSADELMKLRWHWTLDETNAKAMGFTEYARQVGVDEKRVRVDARAWESYLAAKATSPVARPGAPTSPADFRELSRHSADKQQAVQALAKATGKSVSNVANHKREDVAAVLNTARSAVERKAETGKPSTLEAEIEKAAEWHVKVAKTAEAEKARNKSQKTATLFKIENKLGAMLQQGRDIMALAEGVAFSDEEIAIITDALGKVRALLGMIDLRITGDLPAELDWDNELAKLTK